MNKKNFIEEVSSITGFSSDMTGTTINTALKVITETLAKGNTISLVGFGTFSTTLREERKTKIPKKEDYIIVPAIKLVKFKVGKNLKKTIADSIDSNRLKGLNG